MRHPEGWRVKLESMKRLESVRRVVLLGLLGGVAAGCAAQTYTPPPPPLTTLPPCPADRDAKKRAKRKDCDPTVYPPETVETKGKKIADAPPAAAPAAGTAAQKFPFPGEQPAPSSSAAKTFPYPGESSPDAPQDPAAAARAAEKPASKAFPYPGGETPDLPGNSAGPTPKPDDASSSSSSSSSSGDDVASDAGRSPGQSAAKNPDDDDEDQPRLKDKGSEGQRRRKVVKVQTDTERVDEDLNIAKYYGQSGNYMGAYLRAKDAVRTQPDYPDGHFVLGEAAKRLKKNDEAAVEFHAYLKLSPDGQNAKAAEKALDELH